MTYNPKISVVCPCYNHGRYIQEMLASVFAQSFQAYEIIIVNDGSTDGTKMMLDNLHHEKLTVIHTQNYGPSAARNTAIAAAKAPLILNLDADDKIAPSFLAEAYKIFNTKPHLGIVTSEVRYFGARSDRFELPPYSLKAMLRDNVIHSTAFFKKVDWEAAGGYSNDMVYGLEDYDFWLSIIELGKEVYKLPEELVFYRTYPHLGNCRSGRRKKSRRKMTFALSTIFNRHEKLYKTCPEEYERMLKLKNAWENESPAVQWLKQVYYSLRHTIHWRTR